MDVNESGLRGYFDDSTGFKNGAGMVYYYTATGESVQESSVASEIKDSKKPSKSMMQKPALIIGGAILLLIAVNYFVKD